MPSKLHLTMTFFLLCHVSLSIQCDCNARCAAYVTPAMCVRCCTLSVKRSIPEKVDKKRIFLYEEDHHRRVKRPVWRKEESEYLPLFIRLLLQKNRSSSS